MYFFAILVNKTEVIDFAEDVFWERCEGFAFRSFVLGHFGKVFKGTMQLKEDSDDVDVVAIKTIQGDVLKSRQNVRHHNILASIVYLLCRSFAFN